MGFNRDDFMRYFWYFFGTMGVVFFWAGVWDGFGGLPYLSNPLVSIAVGTIMLVFSGLLRKETMDSFKSAEKMIHETFRFIENHPRKHEFHFQYHDKIKRKEITVKADIFHKVEKGFVVLYHKTEGEIFIPLHRITKVFHKGKEFKHSKNKEEER